MGIRFRLKRSLFHHSSGSGLGSKCIRFSRCLHYSFLVTQTGWSLRATEHQQIFCATSSSSEMNSTVCSGDTAQNLMWYYYIV